MSEDIENVGNGTIYVLYRHIFTKCYTRIFIDNHTSIFIKHCCTHCFVWNTSSLVNLLVLFLRSLKSVNLTTKPSVLFKQSRWYSILLNLCLTFSEFSCLVVNLRKVSLRKAQWINSNPIEVTWCDLLWICDNTVKWLMDDFVTARLIRWLTGPGVFSQRKVIIFIIRLFSEKVWWLVVVFWFRWGSANDYDVL